MQLQVLVYFANVPGESQIRELGQATVVDDSFFSNP